MRILSGNKVLCIEGGRDGWGRCESEGKSDGE